MDCNQIAGEVSQRLRTVFLELLEQKYVIFVLLLKSIFQLKLVIHKMIHAFRILICENPDFNPDHSIITDKTL